jgi:hypothetical protein
MFATNKDRGNQKECNQMSDFAAYKNYYTGSFEFDKTYKVIQSRMTMIDNQAGFGANIVPGGTDLHRDAIMQFEDNVIIGETISPDCPQEGKGGFCFISDKIGFLLGLSAASGKPIHIGATSPLPPQNTMADGVLGGKTMMYRNKFVNFMGKTRQGSKQSAFGINPFASDHIPITQLYDTQFENVNDDAFGYYMDPKKGWANLKDCGEFPCTAPWNLLMMFTGTKFSKARPSTTYSTF